MNLRQCTLQLSFIHAHTNMPVSHGGCIRICGTSTSVTHAAALPSILRPENVPDWACMGTHRLEHRPPQALHATCWPGQLGAAFNSVLHDEHHIQDCRDSNLENASDICPSLYVTAVRCEEA